MEQVTHLVAAATRGYATVNRRGEELEVAFSQGPRLNFTLAVWVDEITPSPDPQTLWILKNPTRRTLEGLRASGASYAALNGAVRLLGRGVVIDRTGVLSRTPRKASQRRSAFSDRASLVPRWLFRFPSDQEWLVTTLAERSGVSPSVASYAISDLEERGLVATERRGRERWVSRIQHTALIRHWASEYNWRMNHSVRVRAPIGSPKKFLHRLSRQRLPRWAAALHTGAWLYAPHANPPSLQIYVDLSRSALRALIAEHDWTPDEEGGLQLLVPHYRRSVWHWTETVDGTLVVSLLQLMLDLWNHPLRGREQADLLLEKHLMGLEQ